MKHVLIATLMTLSLLCSVTHGTEKIRVGVPQQVVHWMVFPLAQQKGFFKEEGFDAEIVRITRSVRQVDLNERRPRLLHNHRRICDLSALRVDDAAEFKSAQDLKNKTKGIGAPPGSSPDVIGKLSLKHLGLNPDKDVKFVI